MTIIIQNYNPLWADYYTLEKIALEHVLEGFDFKIEHIGSTAVVGLGGKPIIDMMIGLPNPTIMNKLIPLIETLEYTYKESLDDLKNFRRYLAKEKFGVRSHQIHIVELNGEFWTKQINLRSYFQNNKRDRDRYFELKKHLGKLCWRDMEEYCKEKGPFLKEIEEKMK